MFSSMNSFLLVAVPLFILVGVLMERGRVAERIFDFAESIVGWLPGGMGHVNVVSSVIFGGVSGSSVADIASLGAIEIKAMERHGFDKGYAVGHDALHLDAVVDHSAVDPDGDRRARSPTSRSACCWSPASCPGCSSRSR